MKSCKGKEREESWGVIIFISFFFSVKFDDFQNLAITK